MFEDPRSLHRYTYAHNNPTNFSDPSRNLTLAESATVLSVIGVSLIFLQQSFTLTVGLSNSVNFAGSSTSGSVDTRDLKTIRGI